MYLAPSSVALKILTPQTHDSFKLPRSAHSIPIHVLLSLNVLKVLLATAHPGKNPDRKMYRIAVTS